MAGMRGPRRSHRAPVFDGLGAVKLVRGRVISVEPIKYTASVLPDWGGRGEMPIDGVQINPITIDDEGGGQFWLPQVNTLVWLLWPSTDADPVIFAAAGAPRQIDEGDAAEDPNDYRQFRPVINPGDHGTTTRDGNFVYVRRGGAIEIGSTQMAQRIYSPIGNTIRDLVQNYEMISTGGNIEFKTKLTDESTVDRTPVEFRMQVREFAQGDPIIDLGLGRIAEEDEELLQGGIKGDIVARIIINKQYKFWIDKRGNVQSVAFGSTLDSVLGTRRTFTRYDFFERVVGLFEAEVGERRVKVNRRDELTVRGEREVTVTQKYTETIEGAVLRETGPRTETVRGTLDQTVEGIRRVRALSGHEEKVIGPRGVAVTKDVSYQVGGKVVLKVANGEANSDAIEIHSAATGAIRIHGTAGRVFVSSGSPGFNNPQPAGELSVTPTGGMKFEALSGVASLEVNGTGCRVKTPAGEIAIDNAGQVLLGPPGRGYVVTTATHPVDRVTGTPISGTASVLAGGIPAIAAVPPIPNTFVAEPDTP